MGDSCGTDAVLTVATNIVTWMLVVFGWLLVSDQNDQSEAAKNSYARMNRLRDEMRQIEATAVEHHTGGFDEKRVRIILRSISALGMEVTQLVKNRYLGGGAIAFVTELRKAVTVNNFDLSRYELQPPTSTVVQEIEAARDQLDRVLLEASDAVSSRPRTLIQSMKTVQRRLW